jgi:4-hydroxy-tetrahydrodipicolinate reductase
MPKKIYKVIQWSSGNVGKASIRGICNRSDLELVGLIVSNEKKNGLDAGTLSEIDEIGVLASTNIEEVLSLDADCVNYTPLASLRLGDDPDADKKKYIISFKKGV